MVRSHVLICGGTGCTSSKSVEIKNAMEAEIIANGLQDEVSVVMTGCFGLCALGPIMIVYPEGTFYSNVTVADVLLRDLYITRLRVTTFTTQRRSPRLHSIRSRRELLSVTAEL